MYHEYYNLQSMPFENTPDPRFFFASEHHREALAAVEYTIRMRKGFVLITGEIGSGKTTVTRTVCEQCSDQARLVPVLHGHQTPVDLLRQILRAMGARMRPEDDRSRLLERLQAHLHASLSDRRPVVLMVDEAQTLGDEALEELRLLSNFDTSTDKLVQVVLVGHPELRSRISQPHLAALRQRIVLAKQLRGLSQEETATYIRHRLVVAGANPQKPRPSFEPQAIAEVFAASGGMPRLINVMCDNCLLLGFVTQTDLITVAMARRVMEDMVPVFDEPSASVPTNPVRKLTGSTLSLAGNF